MDPPSLRCVNVESNGDVTLTWLPPADPLGEFDAYLIYSSTSVGGPFLLLDSVKIYAQTSYIHTGAQAQTTIHYYYLVTRYDSNAGLYSIPSDTLASMVLTVINPLNGTAHLLWTPLKPTLLPSHSAYEIHVENPPGNWNLIANTLSTQYIDTILVCHDSLTYAIRVSDQSGCISSSSLDGDIFDNIIPPVNPGLDSVSVEHSTNLAILGWQPSPSTDTKGYVIYQFSASAWQPLDTVWGRFNTSYTNLSSQANVQVEIYAIASFDSCGTISPISSSHTTMIATVSYDSCMRKAFLSWSPYTAWPSAKYYIYRQINASGYVLVDSTFNTTYTDTLIQSPAQYCYYVKASNQLYTSSSNEVCLSVELPTLPAFAYLRKASIQTNNNTLLSWYVDPDAPIEACLVYASSDQQQWELRKTIPYQPTGHYEWIDPSGDAQFQSIFYRVGIKDECGFIPLYSNTVKTMHLRARPTEGLINTLTWNTYEGWHGIGDFFLIKTPTHVADTAIVSISPSLTSYEDDISMWTSTDGYFSYQLMAIEDATNPFGFRDTVYSNVAYVYQWPRLFVPNAFSPEGLNRLYCVHGVFVDNASYSIDILSRWGNPVYHSSNIKECWDGTKNGSPLPFGVYMYKIQLIFPDGTQFNKHGSITLLR